MKDISYLDDTFVREVDFVLGPMPVIVSDKLQVFNDLINVHLTRLVRPASHIVRVKDSTETCLIDNHSFQLFECGGFLFAVRNTLLGRRDFHDWLRFLFFIATGSADSSGDECVNKQPRNNSNEKQVKARNTRNQTSVVIKSLNPNLEEYASWR